MEEMMETELNQTETCELQEEAVQEGVWETAEEERMEEAAEAAEEAPRQDEMTERSGDNEPVNYLGQVKELLAGYPELEGKQIPSEVVAACVRGESTLAEAYSRYQSRMLREENKQLRSQLAGLQQNRENIRRAPVIGTAHAPNPPLRGEDPFLMGFNSED